MDYRDIPITSIKQDAFGVAHHVIALCEFLKASDTPMTLAIQGEWGSGKSSFMRMMEEYLCNKELSDDERFEAIWINAWELFMENDCEEAVKKIVLEVLRQMEKHFEKNKKMKSEKAKKVLGKYARTLSRTVSTMALNATGLDVPGADDFIDNVFGEKEQGMQEAKKDLQDFLNEEIEKKDNGITNRAFIIFVDDLDRLNPGMAVTLLEAMKNLIDMEKCFFVLAIDSDVVSCGIQEKYGRLQLMQRSLERDFFDKLVQVPYVMPVSQYNLVPMVMERLHAIQFFKNESDYKKYQRMLDEIVTLATKKNPRAAKRLLNMTQLMVIIQRSKSNEEHHPAFSMLEFLLMALQLAFPEVYLMVAQNNDLDSWAAKYIAANTDIEITDVERDEYNLDAPWKEAVFLNAAKDAHMRQSFHRIARLLTLYEDLERRCQKAGESVSEILGIVSVVCRRTVEGVEVQFQGSSYDEHSGTQFSQGVKFLDSIDLTKYERTMDIGCGNGMTTLELFRRNTDMVMDAFDIEESQVEVAKGHWADFLAEEGDGVTGRIDFYVMDALDLDAHNQFDLIYSNSTLHWVTDQEKVYELIFEALKPGGDIAVHVGAKGTYEELHEVGRRAIANLGLSEKYVGWEFPALYCTKEYMEGVISKAGFVDVKIDYVERDESENATLVEDFAVASLSQYKIPSVTKTQFNKIRKEYFRICKEEPIKPYSRRLYIHAHKPE